MTSRRNNTDLHLDIKNQDLIISLPRARILDYVGVGNSVQSRKNFAIQMQTFYPQDCARNVSKNVLFVSTVKIVNLPKIPML